ANTVSARLDSIDPSLALVENNPLTVMAGRVADPINRMIPISAGEAAKLQKQLMQAGYRSPDAATAVRAIQITMLIAMPSIASVVCYVLDRPLMNLIVGGLLGAAAGFYLPRYVLRKKIAARQRRITWGLADAMDLMVVAVEAGLGLNAALNRVGQE